MEKSSFFSCDMVSKFLMNAFPTDCSYFSMKPESGTCGGEGPSDYSYSVAGENGKCGANCDCPAGMLRLPSNYKIFKCQKTVVKLLLVFCARKNQKARKITGRLTGSDLWVFLSSVNNSNYLWLSWEVSNAHVCKMKLLQMESFFCC